MPPTLNYQGCLAKNHGNVFHKTVCFEVNKTISFDSLQVTICFCHNQYPESVRCFYLITLRLAPANPVKWQTCQFTTPR